MLRIVRANFLRLEEGSYKSGKEESYKGPMILGRN